MQMESYTFKVATSFRVHITLNLISRPWRRNFAVSEAAHTRDNNRKRHGPIFSTCL